MKLPWSEKDGRKNDSSRRHPRKVYRLPFLSPKNRRERQEDQLGLNELQSEVRHGENSFIAQSLVDAFDEYQEHAADRSAESMDFIAMETTNRDDDEAVPSGSRFEKGSASNVFSFDERRERISPTVNGFVGRKTRVSRSQQERMPSTVDVRNKHFNRVAAVNMLQDHEEALEENIPIASSETPRSIVNWISGVARRQKSSEDVVVGSRTNHKRISLFPRGLTLRPSMKSNAADIEVSPAVDPHSVADDDIEENGESNEEEITRWPVSRKRSRNSPMSTKRPEGERNSLLLIADLENALEQSERRFAELKNIMEKNRAKMDMEVERMNNIFESLGQHQEQRCHFIFSAINDNYKMLSALESQADYMMCLVNKAKQASFQEVFKRCKWFILEKIMAGVFWAIHSFATIYSMFNKKSSTC